MYLHGKNLWKVAFKCGMKGYLLISVYTILALG